MMMSTEAVRLAAEYNRARRIWSAGRPVWFDVDGRVAWTEPADRPTHTVELTPRGMSAREAQELLDRLAGELRLAECRAEQERRAAVMASSWRLGGFGGDAA